MDFIEVYLDPRSALRMVGFTTLKMAVLRCFNWEKHDQPVDCWAQQFQTNPHCLIGKMMIDGNVSGWEVWVAYFFRYQVPIFDDYVNCLGKTRSHRLQLEASIENPSATGTHRLFEWKLVLPNKGPFGVQFHDFQS